MRRRPATPPASRCGRTSPGPGTTAARRTCGGTTFAALQNKAHVLADHLRDDGRAVEVLSEAVRYYPDGVLPRAGRGVSLARLGRRAEAVEDAREALLLDVRAPNLYQVGCIYALT